MKKSTKTAFILFNVVYFVFNHLVISVMPRFIVFGLLPSHCLFYLGAMIVAAFVWGAYFKRFYDIQDQQPAFFTEGQEPGKEEAHGEW